VRLPRCHRDLKPGESLTALERLVLKLINRIYFLPPWVSVDTYVQLAGEAGLKVRGRCPGGMHPWRDLRQAVGS
jgi:hypothetical protein